MAAVHVPENFPNGKNVAERLVPPVQLIGIKVTGECYRKMMMIQITNQIKGFRIKIHIIYASV